MKVYKFIGLFWLLFMVSVNCTNWGQEKPAKGTLQISWELADSEDKSVVPSYQTVIWLQNDNADTIKSVLVSEYLSYGGYNDTTICTDWIKVADWDNALEETFDAVTKATPPIGPDTISIDCKSENIFPGTYNYFIETHIVENYNILYKGKITIGKKPATSTAEHVYIPQKHPVSGDVLKNVSAKYQL